MIIKNKTQKQAYKTACRISTQILRELYNATQAGVYPIEIDDLAGKLCKKYNIQPAFYSVPGRDGIYGYNTCVQLNDVAVHGVPSSTQAIKNGDLVTVDFGIIYQNLYTDHCFTVGIKPIKDQDLKLLKISKDSVLKAIKQAKTGNYTGDIGYVLESEVQKAGYDTLKNYIGHGIGHSLHDEPEIPAWGNRGEGQVLVKNQIICIESQVTAGKAETKIDSDGWTARTIDGTSSAMFEYIVRVDNIKPEILTDTRDLELIK